MSINNWDLWHAAKKKKADTQAIKRLERTGIVKDQQISAKGLLKQLKEVGLKVQPELETEYDWEWNYRDVHRQSRNVAIMFWVIAVISIVALVTLLVI